jgi:FkbM family methyltransferase
MHLNLIQKYFNPEHILDIGGHTGEFFLLAKQFFPYADIFVVEGNKDCEPYLKELNTPYLIRLLGSEKKKTVFYKNKQDLISTGNSIYREVTPHFSDENLIKEEIQQYTIDTTFKEADFDLIKLDTQGSEIDILKGGERIAKKAKGILMEVSVEKYNEGSPLYNEIVDFMDRYGFLEKETLAEYESVTEYNLKVHQKDILFINKNLI